MRVRKYCQLNNWRCIGGINIKTSTLTSGMYRRAPQVWGGFVEHTFVIHSLFLKVIDLKVIDFDLT